MDTEMNKQELGADAPTLTTLEIDTIGEILNISMGSAATAISTMLDQKVVISTPNVEVRGFSSLDYVELEPSMMVKIDYVEGISGRNVMIFRQRDMQIILSLLMGEDEPPSEEFVFDELSISAACEVMNQMMGASATALSDFLNRVINISTPEATTVDSRDAYRTAAQVQEGEAIVSVSFRLTIEDVMDSNFASIMSIELAKDIIRQVMGEQEKAIETIVQMVPAAAGNGAEPEPRKEPVTVGATANEVAPPPPTYTPPAQDYTPPKQEYVAPPVPEYTAPPEMPPMPSMPPVPPQQPAYVPPANYNPTPYGGYAAGQPEVEDMSYQVPPVVKGVNVQNTQFPQFTPGQTQAPATSTNMDLLMGVSLDVSVQIGKTKRKIKDIVEFGQGTVIELNKQAGAPVDIVVNGCLLARGDVVVIDDNFGVRITEIVGAKELMDTLKEENGL